MATILCGHGNGVVLRLHEKVNGPLGIVEFRSTGEPVTLRHGRNEVDDDFWARWSEQNAGSAAADLLSEERREAPKP
jgi:hypothetical protein